MSKFLVGSLALSLSMNVWPQGLKKVDYHNKTAETQNGVMHNEGSGLSPEEQKKLLENVEAIKAKQLESKKILEELEKDE